MNLRLIRWRLPLSYAAIALLAVLLLGLILISTLLRYYIGQEIDYLNQNALGIGILAANVQENETSPETIQQLLNSFAFLSNTQVRLLDKDGETLMDTGPPQNRLEVLFDNDREGTTSPFDSAQSFIISGTVPATPEIGEEDPALESSYGMQGITISYQVAPFPGLWIGVPGASARIGGFAGISDERSTQIVQRPYYNKNDQLMGYVELSNGPAYGRGIIESVIWGWAISGSVAVLLAAFVGWVISRRFSNPLTALTEATRKMAAGNLSARAHAETPDEFGTLGRSFNFMAQHIEAMVRALRNFVSDAAHELNTPLTALYTNLELIEDQIPNSALNDLKQAKTQVMRLQELVKNLLALSRIEATPPQQTDVNQKNLVQEIGELYASRAEQKEITFTLELPESAVSVPGDPKQLRRMIENLLHNAIKFTPAGGSVELKLSLDDQQTYLQVQDTGIGIPVENQDHIFQRFYRARNAASYPGSGLGLAIVKAIVDRHNGEVRLESVSAGTCVKVTLPRAQVPS